LLQVKEYFHKAGIHSTTIQLEYGSELQSTGSCRLLCPKKSLSSGEMSLNCIESSCCRERIVGKMNEAMVEEIDVMTKL